MNKTAAFLAQRTPRTAFHSFLSRMNRTDCRCSRWAFLNFSRVVGVTSLLHTKSQGVEEGELVALPGEISVIQPASVTVTAHAFVPPHINLQLQQNRAVVFGKGGVRGNEFIRPSINLHVELLSQTQDNSYYLVGVNYACFLFNDHLLFFYNFDLVHIMS